MSPMLYPPQVPSSTTSHAALNAADDRGSLKAAGKAGVKVKKLAAKLGAKYNLVFTWFYETGKAIKKVGPAKCAWIG